MSRSTHPAGVSRYVVLGWCTLASLPGFAATWLAPQMTKSGLPSEICRLLEGGATVFLLVNLALALLLAGLRFRRVALCLAVLSVIAALSLGVRVYRLSVAPGGGQGEAIVRVLWWNMLNTNPISPDQLVAEVVATQADVVFLGEAAALDPADPVLRQAYPHQLGCVQRPCDLLVLSRLPLSGPMGKGSKPRLGPIGLFGGERLAAFRVDTAQGPLTLVAMHLSKGWYGRLRAGEIHRSHGLLKSLSGPLLVMGDFNAPPWGQAMTSLAQDTGAKLAWPASPTWPASLGRFGLGIDHALTRGGAYLTRLDPLDAPGSNHRGLVADVGLMP